MTNLPATTGGELEVTRHVNPAVQYIAGLAPSGQATMISSLKRIAKTLGVTDWRTGVTDWRTVSWQRLDAEKVAQIIAMLKAELTEDGDPKYKASTINRYLACLKGVARVAWRNKLMETDTYTRIKDIDGATGDTLLAGRALGMGEVDAFMRACAGDDPASRRDAAIIGIAYAAGLRREEIARLKVSDIVSDDGELITIKVLGKRNKERPVYLDNGAGAVLRAWFKVRGTAPGAIFHEIGRDGKAASRIGKRMTPQSIMNIIQTRATQAGVHNVTPHDFRRTFITSLLEAGIDISTVAALAGHSSVRTTQRYDRRGETAKIRAVRALHLPYYDTTGK